MISAPELRLAARTLLEWESPPDSPEYRQVRIDLLRLHPTAAMFGLRPESPHWQLDEHGDLTWYLSRTLDQKIVGSSGAIHVKSFEPIERYVLELVTDFSSGKHGRAGSLNIYERRAFLGALQSCLESVEFEPKFLGYLALFSICIPLASGSRDRLVRRVLSKVPAQGWLVRTIARTVFLPIEWWGPVLGGVSALAAFVAVMYFPHLAVRGLVLAEQIGPLLHLLAIATLTVVMGIVYIALSRFLRPVAEQLGRLLVSDLKIRSLDQRTFRRALLYLIEDDASCFDALVVEPASRLFLPYVLRDSFKLSPTVFRRALRVLRSADVKSQVKDRIFSWLCGIELASEDTKSSNTSISIK